MYDRTTIKIFLTNLGKYNEGYFVMDIGKWVTLPISTEDFNKELIEIGVDGDEYEEYFITDYETDFVSSSVFFEELGVGEYSNPLEISKKLKRINELENYNFMIFETLLFNDYGYEDSIEKAEEGDLACIQDNPESYARERIEEYCDCKSGLMDVLEDYFDFKAYGETLLEGAEEHPREHFYVFVD